MLPVFDFCPDLRLKSICWEVSQGKQLVHLVLTKTRKGSYKLCKPVMS